MTKSVGKKAKGGVTAEAATPINMEVEEQSVDFDMPEVKLDEEEQLELPFVEDDMKVKAEVVKEKAKVEASEEELSEADRLLKEAEEEKRKKEEEDKKLKEEYLKIFDTIMFEGSYEEVVPLGRSYKATFRSRSSKEDLNIAKRLDGMVFNTTVAYQNQSSLLTLAYTLVQYNNLNMRDMSINERYEYICKLPSAVILVLSSCLVNFDTKIIDALSYGRENF